MAIVYINLHPNYSYATAIISGFVDVREYVKNVEWLSWEPSKTGTRQIMISGPVGNLEAAKTQHIVRATVFSQRMLQLGVEVFVRNERTDEWEKWKKNKTTLFSSDDLLKIECQRDREPHEVRWAKENIEKYRGYVEFAEKTASEQLDTLRQMLKEEEERLADCLAHECARVEAIKNIWA